MAMTMQLTEPTRLITTSDSIKAARNENTTTNGNLINFNPFLFVQKVMELKADQDGYPGTKVTVREVSAEEKTA